MEVKISDWVVVLGWRFAPTLPVLHVGQVLSMIDGNTLISHCTSPVGRWASHVRPATQEEVSRAQLSELEGL